MADPASYDEFGLFEENAEEAGLEWHGPPTVRRERVELDDGRALSALVWGDGPAELVFLHGGGQNAHTFDTVALALDRPMVCIDLPSHGHSDDAAADRPMGPSSYASDVAEALDALAPAAAAVVGMSLGGMTAVALAAARPDLVRKLVLVDVTPGVDHGKASDIVSFLAGPESFATFDEILDRTIQFNPTRSESSLRRGVLHNAVQRDDGSWVWRHQRGRARLVDDSGAVELDFGALWDAIEASTMPLLLARGGMSPVVDDDDVAELERRRPDATVVTVDDAGHSIQGDRPLELARIVAEFA